jgi:hypothetical protein
VEFLHWLSLIILTASLAPVTATLATAQSCADVDRKISESGDRA